MYKDQLSLALEVALTNEEMRLQCPKMLDRENPNAGSEKVCSRCIHRINAEEYLNCDLIAREIGEFNQVDVARMMGCAQSTVSELEESAIKKIKLAIDTDRFPSLKSEKERRERRKISAQNSMKADIDILEAIVKQHTRRG